MTRPQACDLENSIEASVNIQNIKVLLLKASVGASFNRNVVAINKSGDLLWTIQECPHGTQDDKPYCSIEVNNDRLVAANWIGIDYFVNVHDGTVEVMAFNK